jgi:hypothetical protein
MASERSPSALQCAEYSTSLLSLLRAVAAVLACTPHYFSKRTLPQTSSSPLQVGLHFALPRSPRVSCQAVSTPKTVGVAFLSRSTRAQRGASWLLVTHTTTPSSASSLYSRRSQQDGIGKYAKRRGEGDEPFGTKLCMQGRFKLGHLDVNEGWPCSSHRFDSPPRVCCLVSRMMGRIEMRGPCDYCKR